MPILMVLGGDIASAPKLSVNVYRRRSQFLALRPLGAADRNGKFSTPAEQD